MQNRPPERFWEVDLRVLLLQWWNDIAAFALTALMFCALSLPVVIPSLIMWFMLANNISFETPP
jgi:uncharacterized RDD family membrane protein YckC